MIFPTAKTFWLWTAGLAGLEVLSWLAYTNQQSETLVTSVVAIILIILAWKRPVWLAYGSVAEAVVGGKGYLLFLMLGGFEISLRMIIFLLLLAASVTQIIKRWATLRQTIIATSLRYFSGWLLVAVVIALWRHTPIQAIYTDANAFLYLALLPAWWVTLRLDPRWRERILVVLLAGATIIGLKSWLMVALFGQDISGIAQIYHWIRNTGIGEITYINANVYRVFFQSQVYSLLVFCLSLVVFLRQSTPRWWLVPMAASALGVYISLSRSFWLGLGAALIVLVTWLVKRREWKALSRIWIVLPVGLFAWAMMVWAISFPSFNLSGGRATTVVARLQGSDSASASTSRANQIQPLVTSISRHPVIGSGFGAAVTYVSTDPRSPGLHTTSAFELGYLDLWLKIGLVGVILYAAWIIGLGRRLHRTVWGPLFIFSGIALLTVNATSPYLNHPLGLSWLMIAALYAYDPG